MGFVPPGLRDILCGCRPNDMLLSQEHSGVFKSMFDAIRLKGHGRTEKEDF
jgi:hypothetical protein